MSSATPSAVPIRAFLTEKVLMGLAPRAYLRSLLTPFDIVAGIILAVGIPVIVWRFLFGLGSVTNLSQANPWGLWVGLDVVTGVALAAGGYTVACAVYIFGQKEFSPVVRPAILTGFLGYLFVVLGLCLDLGQPWRLPYPVFVSWGTTSVMFEVGWCVFLYLTVLAFEFSPALLEWLGLKKIRLAVQKITVGAIIFGIILSTLHQSSLGALFLMAKDRLHPLWYTPFMPVYFFISSIAAGLGMVIVEGFLSHRAFRDQFDPARPVNIDRITLGLSKGASLVLFSYFFLKLQGVADGNHWSLLATGYGIWFLVEMLGFVLLPSLLFAFAARSESSTLARWAATLTVLGVVLNRLNVAIIALGWNAPVRYVPTIWEVWASLTVITLGVLTFRWIVNRMPVLHPHPEWTGNH